MENVLAADLLVLLLLFVPWNLPKSKNYKQSKNSIAKVGMVGSRHNSRAAEIIDKMQSNT